MEAAEPDDIFICDICGSDFTEESEYGLCPACTIDLLLHATPEELAAVRQDLGLGSAEYQAEQAWLEEQREACS